MEREKLMCDNIITASLFNAVLNITCIKEEQYEMKQVWEQK